MLRLKISQFRRSTASSYIPKLSYDNVLRFVLRSVIRRSFGSRLARDRGRGPSAAHGQEAEPVARSLIPQNSLSHVTNSLVIAMYRHSHHAAGANLSTSRSSDDELIFQLDR